MLLLSLLALKPCSSKWTGDGVKQGTKLEVPLVVPGAVMQPLLPGTEQRMHQQVFESKAARPGAAEGPVEPSFPFFRCNQHQAARLCSALLHSNKERPSKGCSSLQYLRPTSHLSQQKPRQKIRLPCDLHGNNDASQTGLYTINIKMCKSLLEFFLSYMGFEL